MACMQWQENRINLYNTLGISGFHYIFYYDIRLRSIDSDNITAYAQLII